MINLLHDLAKGPFVWFASAVLATGFFFRIYQLFALTRKKEKVAWPTHGIRSESPEERKNALLLRFQRSLPGKYPVMTLVSGLFHISLFIAPLFALGHALLFRQSWGFTLLSLPDRLVDTLTAFTLAGSFFLLVRRIALSRVRSVSGLSDYVFIFLTAMPYLTGFLAYHQWLNYRTVITLHMLTGELLMIMLPFTKPVHMIFIVFSRAFIRSEHNPGPGGREWIS